MMNPLRMVRAELKRRLPSSLGILLLLSLAFSATVTVSIFERGLRQAGARTSKDTDLVIGAAGSSLQIVLTTVFLQITDVPTLMRVEVMDRLAADPRVKSLSPLVFADHYRGSPIVGIGPDFPHLKPVLKPVQGRWPTAEFEAMAGSAAGLHVGDEIESSHGVVQQSGSFEEAHTEARYKIVGLLKPTQTPWDRGIYTPYQSLWAIHGIKALHAESGPDEDKRGISAILVQPKDFAAAYALRADYGKGDLAAVFPGEVLARLFSVFQDVRTAFTVLSVLFQLIVFAAVILSLLASLPTRTRWIGMLRALGASRAYIFLTLWIQSAVVFLLAGLVGATVGWMGCALLAGLVEARTGLHLPLSFTLVEVATLGVFWLVGFLGALLPAWRGFGISVRRAFLQSA